MTLEQWIEKFEKKTHTRWYTRLNDVTVFDEDHGAMAYIIDTKNKHFLITKMVGDGMYWIMRVTYFMRGLQKRGIKHVRYSTQRNPHAFIRKYGGTLLDSRVENGRMTHYVDVSFNTRKEVFPDGWWKQFRDL